jgi:hypothetical protein
VHGDDRHAVFDRVVLLFVVERLADAGLDRGDIDLLSTDMGAVDRHQLRELFRLQRPGRVDDIDQSGHGVS